MNIITLNETDLYTAQRNSSKGNQLKWKKDGFWYKADYLGYEGLAEYIVGKILESSTLNNTEYVSYDTVMINYNETEFYGCRSKDIMINSKYQRMITLERLFKSATGESLTKMINNCQSAKARLRFIVDNVERISGLRNFGQYMNKLFTIDALTLNEDRHMHNIAVIQHKDGSFGLCPIFDHGAAFMSDITLDYKGKDVIGMMKKVKSKSVASDFFEQIDASEELYGNNLKFDFGYDKVSEWMQNEDIYSEEHKKRVIEIIMQKRREYEYLFL